MSTEQNKICEEAIDLNKSIYDSDEESPPLDSSSTRQQTTQQTAPKYEIDQKWGQQIIRVLLFLYPSITDEELFDRLSLRYQIRTPREQAKIDQLIYAVRNSTTGLPKMRSFLQCRMVYETKSTPPTQELDKVKKRKQKRKFKRMEDVDIIGPDRKRLKTEDDVRPSSSLDEMQNGI